LGIDGKPPFPREKGKVEWHRSWGDWWSGGKKSRDNGRKVGARGQPRRFSKVIFTTNGSLWKKLMSQLVCPPGPELAGLSWGAEFL